MYDRYRIPSRNTAERAQPKSATSGGADPVRRRQPVARATATSDLGIPVRGQCCPPGRRPGGPRPEAGGAPPEGGPKFSPAGPIFFWDADVAPKIAFFIKTKEVFSTIVYDRNSYRTFHYISLHFTTVLRHKFCDCLQVLSDF